MTERGRSDLRRSHNALTIGRTTATWEVSALCFAIDETAAPIPRPIRGRVEVRAEAVNRQAFFLERQGRHWWRPLAPQTRVTVEMEAPALSWRGTGYFDQNAGAEPIERAFSRWTWSRANMRNGAAILYDAVRRREPPLSLALGFDRHGGFEERRPPPPAVLPPTRWRLSRTTRADDARASVVRSFEDTPFYSRSLVAHDLFGERAESVHESLSLDRLSRPIVRAMLPFRMPRW